jgi:hypothetical protein
MEHMCDAIELYFGFRANEAILTKASDEVHEENRKKADALCPDGYCLEEVKKYIIEIYGPDWKAGEITEAFQEALKLQCDEFPFARTVEGSNSAKGSKRCIPGTENSWQGGKMNKYFKEFVKRGGGQVENPFYIKDGEKFVIKMEGWDCIENVAMLAETKRKRQEATALEGDLGGG